MEKILLYNGTKVAGNANGIVGKTLIHVLRTVTELVFEECEDPASADVMLLFAMDSKHCPGFFEFKKLYSKDQSFLILSTQKKEPENLPENVTWVHITDYLPVFLDFFKNFTPDKNRLKRCMEIKPEKLTGNELHVLVVDDTPEHLRCASEQLRDHCVTLANGYDEGLRMIQGNQYDVVLSDCQMPPGVNNSPLSSSAVPLGETVHNGIFLMFPATAQGARFAIVTDANHHSDWVSAIFDSLRSAKVNGQPVRFFNGIGKNWHHALEVLME